MYSDRFYSDEQAVGALNDLARLSGVMCRYYLMSEPQSEDCSAFCRYVKACGGAQYACAKTHLYGVYQAEITNGQYIYYCPMGLVHIASPIYGGENALTGYAVAGPLHMVGADEFLYEDVVPRFGLSEQQAAEARPLLDDIPVLEPTTVSSLSNTLALVCRYLSRRSDDSIGADVGRYLGHINTMGGNGDFSQYPLGTEKALLSCISLCDVDGARKLLNELLSSIYLTCGNNFDAFKARILELVVLLSRAAVEGGANVEEIFGLNYKYLSEIHLYHDFEQIDAWLCRILHRFTECLFSMSDVRHADIIHKATRYIKQNHADSITLDDVAKHVYLSTSYFCKIFNKEMGEGFSSYLNKVRVEQSKKLLLSDKHRNLTDIAGAVGFGDQSYFIKVFRKYVGVSPGEYRKGKSTKS